jgi:hypothetical protein
MDDKTARDMDRLLAGGKLSGPEADAILERVLEDVDRDERRRRPRVNRYWVGAAGAALAAAAAVLLVVYSPGSTDDPTIRVSCPGGTLSACPASSTLVFAAANARAGFLSAYAEPVGHAAERVYYFADRNGRPELVEPEDDRPPYRRAAAPPPALKPGRYRVTVVLADRPLARNELLGGSAAREDADVRATSQVEIVVTE